MKVILSNATMSVLSSCACSRDFLVIKRRHAESCTASLGLRTKILKAEFIQKL